MFRLLAACFLSLTLGFQASAQTAPAAAVGLDLAQVVGPYPTPSSDEGKADLAIVLWLQQTRTADDVARAAQEVKLLPSAYAPALGVDLSLARYPKTWALIEQVAKDVKASTDGLKQQFARPRPYAADARVVPAIALETSPSYPSGHATRGLAIAWVLAELAPERREALLAVGRQVGYNRVLGGVHYPSDVLAGHRLAIPVARAWLERPEHAAQVRDARQAEWGGQP